MFDEGNTEVHLQLTDEVRQQLESASGHPFDTIKIRVALPKEQSENDPQPNVRP